MTGPLDLLDDEPPTGSALEREVDIVDSVEPRKPLPQRLTGGGADPATGDLAATDVDGQVGDLTAMNIKRTYDPHRDLLELHGLERPACSNTPVPRGSHHISSLWSPVVATGSNQRQIGSAPKPPQQAETVAVGCDRLPIGAHGKERVRHRLPLVAVVPLSVKEGVDLLAPQNAKSCEPEGPQDLTAGL
jgi:hypothetical protein